MFALMTSRTTLKMGHVDPVLKIKTFKALVWHWQGSQLKELIMGKNAIIYEEQARAKKQEDEQAQGRTDFGMNTAK